MREAWRAKLYPQRAGIFLTGSLHLLGLVLCSVKAVAEPGSLQILPGALLGTGCQQLEGLLPGRSPPLLLFPCLQKMSPGKGISPFCPLGSSREGQKEGTLKEKINSGCLDSLARPRQDALWLLPLYGKAALS